MTDVDATSGSRFVTLLARNCDRPGRIQGAWNRLKELYTAQNPRAYHNLSHIQACLRCFDESRALADHPDEVETSIWFHDCIYDPRRGDNELRSADMAESELTSLGARRDFVGRVRGLILATAHTSAPADADAALIVDIDLAILGAAPDEFDRYEHAIRTEYQHVSSDAFAVGRSKFLR